MLKFVDSDSTATTNISEDWWPSWSTEPYTHIVNTTNKNNTDSHKELNRHLRRRKRALQRRKTRP